MNVYLVRISHSRPRHDWSDFYMIAAASEDEAIEKYTSQLGPNSGATVTAKLVDLSRGVYLGEDCPID